MSNEVKETEKLYHQIGLLIQESCLSDIEKLGVIEIVKDSFICSHFSYNADRNELVEGEIAKSSRSTGTSRGENE